MAYNKSGPGGAGNAYPEPDRHIPTKEHVLDTLDPTADEQTSVYRYYDENDLLLYVGITSRGIARNLEHNTSKDWWAFVSRQAVEHHQTRPIAEARERALIRKYRPPFNTAFNVDATGVRASYYAFRAIRGDGAPAVLSDIFPRSRRIELDVRHTGNVIHLYSRPADFGYVSKIDLRRTAQTLIASGGRKARLELVDTNDKELVVRILCPRDARDCRAASLMFKFGDENTSVRIKRIDLTFTERTRGRAA